MQIWKLLSIVFLVGLIATLGYVAAVLTAQQPAQQTITITKTLPPTTITVTQSPSQQQTISIAGSTTVAPIAEEIARISMERYPGIKVSVAGIGSGPGIKSVGAGEVDIGMASRDIKSAEFEKYPDLKPFIVAKDSVAIIVHPSNPVEDLSIEQVAMIYAGKITNWKEVGGPSKEIVVVTREAGSGTRATFEKFVMKPNKVEIGGMAVVKPSNGEVRATIATTENAIGYISLGYVDETVKAVSLDGIKPTIENVVAGKYPITRNLYLITKGEPSLVEQAFIGLALSPEGQEIISKLGYIPVLKPTL